MRKLKLFLFIFVLALVGSANAETFTVDNICYITTSESDTELTCKVSARSDGTKYSGNLVIPSTVTYGGNEYKVTAINGSAFSSCKDLTSVKIPASIKSIGSYAFSNCLSLGKVYADDIAAWCAIEFVPGGVNNPLQMAGAFYEGDTPITDLVIPEGVTKISKYAFHNAYKFNSVSLPSSLTEIDDYAFAGSNGITSLHLPANLENVGREVFKGLYNLTAVEIPAKATFGMRAFEDCTSLANVTIQEGVSNLGYAMFKNCTSLRTIVIPNTVTTIGGSAFENCRLQNVTIPNSVTYIGGNAFYWNYLSSVTLPSSVTQIGEYAFYKNNISSITIPSGLTEISKGVFGECPKLTSVTIPAGITAIGDYAFEGCTALRTVNMGENVEAIGTGAFKGCTSLEAFVVPDKVAEVRKSLFEGCTALSSLTIGKSVWDIDYAFKNCNSTEMTLYFNSEKFSDFYTSTNPFADAKITKVVVGDNVKKLADNLFTNVSSISFVELPAGLEEIGRSTFSGCSNLKEINISANDVIRISSGTFYGVPKTECSVKVMADLVDVYEAADYWNEFANIEEMELNFVMGGIKYRGHYYDDDKEWNCTVTGYTHGSNIVIPTNVRYLGRKFTVTAIWHRAFADSDISSIRIPNSVTWIGKEVFWHSEVETVYIGQGVDDLNEDVFCYTSDYDYLETVYLASPYSTKASSHEFYIDNNDFYRNVEIIIPNITYNEHYEWLVKSGKEKIFNIQKWNRSRNVSISSNQMATMFLPYDAIVPEGVSVYRAAEVEDGVLKLTKVTGEIIPRNTGFIVKGEEGTYAFREADTEGTEVESLLTGTEENGIEFGEDGYNYYKLTYSNNKDDFGFYLDNVDGSVDAKPNKAYLKLPKTSGASMVRMRFIDDEANDILTVANEAADNGSDCYNLSGQKVGAAYKGIAVKNGKKIMVK